MGLLMRSYQAASFSDYLDTFEQSRIRNQPASQARKMVLARNQDLLAAYLPWNDKIRIDVNGLNYDFAHAYLFNPRSGGAVPVGEAGGPTHFACPAGQTYCDWDNRLNNVSDAAASDQILYMVRPTTPAASWSHGLQGDLQVVSGRLETEGQTDGPNPAERPWGIVGMRIDNLGASVGTPFEISGVDGGLPVRPRAAGDGQGNFLVVWQADVDGNGWQDIRGRWVDKEGNLLGSEIAISWADGADHTSPTVGVGSDGEGVVLWSVAGPLLDTTEVWGQAVDSQGLLIGPTVEVLSGGGRDYLEPRVASDRSGASTLAWIDRDQASGIVTIRTQRLTSLLAPLGTAQTLSETPAATYFLAPIAIDSSGVSQVQWEARGSERGLGWYAGQVGANGEKLGGEVLLSPPYQP